MVYPLILRGAAALAGKQGSKEVGKRAAGRSDKFMGMVDEVPPARLTDDVMRAGERAMGPPAEKGMSAATKAGLFGTGAAGLAAMRYGNEEKPAKASEPAKSTEEPGAAPGTKPAATKKSATRIAFEREFARNRADGETEFTFNGQTYTTRHDGETPDQHRRKMEEIVDRENRRRAISDSVKAKARAEQESSRSQGGIDSLKKGGKVKAYATGGSVRGAGIAQRGVKKCRMV